MLAKCGFLILVAYVYSAFSASIREPKHVIVDLDAGVDDYQALVFLLLAEKQNQIKISAIILSDGNTALKDVKVNVLRLLEIMNIRHIPIYAGSATTMMHQKKLDNHFGSDGFGDLKLKHTPDLNLIRKDIAPTAIAEMVKRRPNYYHYICLGPLTNLALAMTMYDYVPENIGEIFVMGGNYLEDKPEFNFLADPESAKIVLDMAKKPVTLFTWQACVNDKMTIGWRMNMGYKPTPNPVWTLNDMAERKLFSHWDKDKGYNSCDPILIFLMLHPEYHDALTTHKGRVEVCGEKRAQVILDENAEGEENVKIYHGFNVEEYQKFFSDQFTMACSRYKCNNELLES